MAIISALITAASPFVLTWLTTKIKDKAPILAAKESRVIILRAIVAVGSLLLAVGNILVTGGGEIDPTLVTTALESVLTAVVIFFGATGVYKLQK